LFADTEKDWKQKEVVNDTNVNENENRMNIRDETS
jgi:hypothetical protein